eukprot:TRINITY_DN10318_c0_g1_i1.p1 TRINITY_DN10318_c0_g1~~TRINITY_DN10318_c0_g1_i1.p1  ORF type:complete len:1608 (+),score=701.12 TRINITY_DN10318_c0_g1_i1:148-4971(+)
MMTLNASCNLSAGLASVLDASVEQLKWEKEVGKASFDSVHAKIKKKQRPNVLVVHDKPIKLIAYGTWLEQMGCQVAMCMDGRKAFVQFEATLRGENAPKRYDCIFVELPMTAGVDMIDFAAHVRTEERKRLEKDGKRYHHPMIAICRTKENATAMLRSGYSHFLRTPFVHNLGTIRSLLLPSVYNTRERAILGKKFAMYPDIEGVLGSVANGNPEDEHIERNQNPDSFNEDGANSTAVRALQAKVQYLEVDLDSKRTELEKLKKDEENNAQILGNISKLSMQVKTATAESIKFKTMYNETVDRLLKEKVAKDAERQKRYREDVKKETIEGLQWKLQRQVDDNFNLHDEIAAYKKANQYLTGELEAAVSDEARRRLRMANRITFAAACSQWETPPPSRVATPVEPPPYVDAAAGLIGLLNFLKVVFHLEEDQAAAAPGSAATSHLNSPNLAPVAAPKGGVRGRVPGSANPKGRAKAGTISGNTPTKGMAPLSPRSPRSPRVSAVKLPAAADSDGDTDGKLKLPAAPPKDLVTQLHKFTDDYMKAFNDRFGFNIEEMLAEHTAQEQVRLKEEREAAKKKNKKGKATQAEMKAELDALRQDVKDLTHEVKVLEDQNDDLKVKVEESDANGAAAAQEESQKLLTAAKKEVDELQTQQKELKAKYDSVAPDLEAAKAAFQKERTLRQNAEEKQRVYKTTLESGGLETLQQRCSELEQACEDVKALAQVKQEFLQGIRDLECDRLEELADLRVDCYVTAPGFRHVSTAEMVSRGGSPISLSPVSMSPIMGDATDAVGSRRASEVSTSSAESDAADEDSAQYPGVAHRDGLGGLASSKVNSSASLRKLLSGKSARSSQMDSTSLGGTLTSSMRGVRRGTDGTDCSHLNDARAALGSAAALGSRLQSRPQTVVRIAEPSLLNPRCLDIHRAIGKFLCSLQTSYATQMKLHDMKEEFDHYFKTVDDLVTQEAGGPLPDGSLSRRPSLSDKVLEEIVVSDEKMLRSLTKFLDGNKEIGRETGKAVFRSIKANIEKKAKEDAVRSLEKEMRAGKTPDTATQRQLNDLRKQMDEKSRVIAQCQADRAKLKEARQALQAQLKEEHRGLVKERAEFLAEQLIQERKAKLDAGSRSPNSTLSPRGFRTMKQKNGGVLFDEGGGNNAFYPFVNVTQQSAVASQASRKQTKPPDKSDPNRVSTAKKIQDLQHTLSLAMQQRRGAPADGGINGHLMTPLQLVGNKKPHTPRQGPLDAETMDRLEKAQVEAVARDGKTLQSQAQHIKRQLSALHSLSDFQQKQVLAQAEQTHLASHISSGQLHSHAAAQARSPASPLLAASDLPSAGGEAPKEVTISVPGIKRVSSYHETPPAKTLSSIETPPTTSGGGVGGGPTGGSSRHLSANIPAAPAHRAPHGKNVTGMGGGKRQGPPGVHGVTKPPGANMKNLQGGRPPDPEFTSGAVMAPLEGEAGGRGRAAAAPLKSALKGGGSGAVRTLPHGSGNFGTVFHVSSPISMAQAQQRAQGKQNDPLAITGETPLADLPMKVGVVSGPLPLPRPDDVSPAVWEVPGAPHNADGSNQILPPLKKNPKAIENLVANELRNAPAAVLDLNVNSKFPSRNPFKKER